MRMRVKGLLKDTFRKWGYEVKNLRCPVRYWEGDDSFQRLFHAIGENSLLDEVKCYILYQLAHQALKLGGDVAEIGVYKGGSAKLLAKIVEPSGKRVHLFDTFSGMPPTHPEYDLYKKGDFDDASLKTVKTFLGDCPNVTLYPGFFPDTAIPLVEHRFCFAHVDVDIYRSVMDCCEFFHPRLEPGGVLIFDDYGSPRCPGVVRGVDEYFKAQREVPLYLPTGQCVVIKLDCKPVLQDVVRLT